ncbi:hypothetical protein BH09ACT9_BH09ACT9_28570 [soil metagenome]
MTAFGDENQDDPHEIRETMAGRVFAGEEITGRAVHIDLLLAPLGDLRSAGVSSNRDRSGCTAVRLAAVGRGRAHLLS